LGGNLNELRNRPERVPPEFHQTTWASECAIEFLKNKRDENTPWFLNISIYDPHPPFIPPKEYADRFDPSAMPGPYFQESDLAQQKRLSALDFQDEIRTPEEHDARQKQADYYAMIAQIDDQFARILQYLDETGQRENTVIIFTSDHGESLGDHGLMYKGCRFYEGLVRVPLIFQWAGHYEENIQSDALVELLDLTATLLDISGIEQPEYMQGKSLIPIVTGQSDAQHHRDFVRSEYFDALDPHFTGGTGTFGTMYRNRRYKLCVYHDKDLGELYDLQTDPWEFCDLWNSTEHEQIKHQLIYESFNAHVTLTTDMGSTRIAPM